MNLYMHKSFLQHSWKVPTSSSLAAVCHRGCAAPVAWPASLPQGQRGWKGWVRTQEQKQNLGLREDPGIGRALAVFLGSGRLEEPGMSKVRAAEVHSLRSQRSSVQGRGPRASGFQADVLGPLCLSHLSWWRTRQAQLLLSEAVGRWEAVGKMAPLRPAPHNCLALTSACYSVLQGIL